MSADPLIGHLHRERDELLRHASQLTTDMLRYREFTSAMKAAVRNSDAPVSPAFIRSTLHAYGLGDA
jgi:hypothetical protein